MPNIQSNVNQIVTLISSVNLSGFDEYLFASEHSVCRPDIAIHDWKKILKYLYVAPEIRLSVVSIPKIVIYFSCEFIF